MKRFLPFFLSLFWVLSASCQELPDSAKLMAEMEDSVSAMSIKPVEHPELLLKRCLERMEMDLMQKHSKRQYMYKMFIYYKGTLRAGLTVSKQATIEHDDGICLTGPDKILQWDVLNVKTPKKLKRSTLDKLEFSLITNCDVCFLHLQYDDGYYVERGVRLPVYQDLVKYYDIEAYSIRNEDGRGVYRIDLGERKIKTKDDEHSLAFPSYRIRLYFDEKSLRLIQHRGDLVNMVGRLECYKYDYEEENGSPILKQALRFVLDGEKIIERFSVQLMEGQ